MLFVAFCKPRNTRTIKAALERGHDGSVKHEGFVQRNARLHVQCIVILSTLRERWAAIPFSMSEQQIQHGM